MGEALKAIKREFYHCKIKALKITHCERKYEGKNENSDIENLLMVLSPFFFNHCFFFKDVFSVVLHSSDVTTSWQLTMYKFSLTMF